MKIVHVSHLYYPSQGGVQTFFKNVSERLVKDYGDDVTVVTTDSLLGPEKSFYEKAGAQKEVINGVKVLRFSYRRWHKRPYAVFAKILSKLSIKMPESLSLYAYGPVSSQMHKYLVNVSADAICASSSNYYFMQLPLWRKCNFYYYGSIHLSDNLTKSSLCKKQLQSINASTLYLANTIYEKDHLLRYGVNKDKIFVLGTGVDMNPFVDVSSTGVCSFRTSLGLSSDDLVIGYVGRIEVTKNVILIVKAFEKVGEVLNNVHLLIAGAANEYVKELQHYCLQLPEKIRNRITWNLNFSGEEKALIFNSIDVFALPSHNESFGLVFLEAWSSKKPVIGAATGAVSNVIEDGVDGLLMNVNDEKSLAEKLTVLLSDKALRSKMGEAGYLKVKNNFTWDIIVARLRHCYVTGSDINTKNVGSYV